MHAFLVDYIGSKPPCSAVPCLVESEILNPILSETDIIIMIIDLIRVSPRRGYTLYYGTVVARIGTPLNGFQRMLGAAWWVIEY
jgi:hypothetical protein